MRRKPAVGAAGLQERDAQVDNRLMPKVEGVQQGGDLRKERGFSTFGRKVSARLTANADLNGALGWDRAPLVHPLQRTPSANTTKVQNAL